MHLIGNTLAKFIFPFYFGYKLWFLDCLRYISTYGLDEIIDTLFMFNDTQSGHPIGESSSY